MTTNLEAVEQLLSDICYQSHRHEVDSWKDAPGTPEERLAAIIRMAREALAIVREQRTKPTWNQPYRGFAAIAKARGE